MGQSLKKLAPGLLSNSSYFKARALNFEVVDELLGELSILSKETGAKERSDENKEREIGQIIEDSYEKYFGEAAINKLSREVTTSDSYFTRADHYLNKGQKLKKEEFQNILQKIIIQSGFTGFGSKDTILFIFGIPLITYFIKQRVAPKSIPNEVFIPGVTSASVYLLAKLNKT
uniref:Uncharacterized protein n=1 Tax=Salix viminalis TaxID=40686 RepID=A0A6N2JZT1_SALVM